MQKPTREFEVVPVAQVLRTAHPIEDEGAIMDPSEDDAGQLPPQTISASAAPAKGEN